MTYPTTPKRMILAILRELGLLFLLAGGYVSLMYAIGVAVGVR